MSERVQVSINGERRELEVRAEESAVEVLRDRLGLTGAKLVCGEGVCGACTVLLDAVPVASCLLPATALDDRAVTTVEGFGRDLHPVQRAFIARAGSSAATARPGSWSRRSPFTTAGAVHEAARNPHGTRSCRRWPGTCAAAGAYVGIIAAVIDACAGRFDTADLAAPRVEASEKVTGRAVYTTDVRHEGQLEGVILRSPHPHARVSSVDLAPALALPGVGAAVALLGKERLVRYVGQEVGAVAAADRHTAKQALA